MPYHAAVASDAAPPAVASDAAPPAVASDAAVRLVAAAVVPMEPPGQVYRPGVVDLAGDRITWVGPAGAAPPHHGPQLQLSGLLLPGLVNCHAHSPMTLLRGVGEGLPLHDWLRKAIWPREAHLTPDDVYWGMTLACDELLRCGVTTSCESYFHDRRVVDAAVDAGLRCVVTPGILDPAGSGAWRRLLDIAVALHGEAHGRAGLIEIGFGPHAAYSLPLEALATTAHLAAEVDALVTLHVAETAAEGAALEAEHGMTVPALLASAGILDGRVLAAHGVWLTDDDVALFARHDVAVAHCPQSNAKLGSGVARLPHLLRSGIRVGLGTDGPASNNDLDVWEELRLAPLLARAVAGDAGALGAADALALATRGGGRALGLPVGCLHPGYLADLIHVRLDDSRFVPVLDDADLVSHLVWSGCSALVEDVWVGGRQVVRAGVCTTVDGRRARHEVQRRAERLAGAVAQPGC